MNPSELVLRVLGSIGHPAEASLYLSSFRRERRESFAIIAVGEDVVHDELDALAVDLHLLSRLGLTPVLAFETPDHVAATRDALDPEVAARVTGTSDAPAAARAGAIPLLVVESDEQLAELARRLRTRKVIWLGLAPGLILTSGQVPSLIDLTTEYGDLCAPGQLAPDQQRLLTRTRDLLCGVDHPMTVAVTSPLNLLRELFTVRGAGTLIRIGAAVSAHGSYASVDSTRLLDVMTSAFGAAPNETFFARPVDRVYVAGDYLGAAIVEQTSLAPYLTKFAVDLQARGEGIGRDLWGAMKRDYTRLFWRTSRDNSIASWYLLHCDGMARTDRWNVFWRGLEPGEIPAAIAHALAVPADFP